MNKAMVELAAGDFERGVSELREKRGDFTSEERARRDKFINEQEVGLIRQLPR